MILLNGAVLYPQKNMHPSDFIHPEDAAALRQMENLPGFAAIAKKVMDVCSETLYYGLNMASSIRLSERQLPDLHRHLPPICQQLGIPVPEFYLEMSPFPNACTFGDTRIFIKITSALVEMMTDEEIDAVLAHECGHILCRHVLYHNIANWIKRGMDRAGILGSFATPVKYALLYWYRKSELSADRVSAFVTSPQTTAGVMAKLAGGLSAPASQINFQEWAKQADEYESIKNANTWNNLLQLSVIAELDHPFSAVRVREILKWGESEQYHLLKKNKALAGRTFPVCPKCGKTTENGWRFCRYCGEPLK